MNPVQLYEFGKGVGKTGLVAYYKLDSNANDFTKNSHNGISTNISYSNAGKVSNCATFNGTTSFISVPQSHDFDFTNGTRDIPFSISVWVNLTASSPYGIIACKNGLGGVSSWEVRKKSIDNKAEIVLSDSVNFRIWTSTNPLINGTWCHLVIVYDGSAVNSSMKMYINNVLQTLIIANIGTYSKMGVSTQPLILGKRGDNTLYFNGKVDELAIYRNKTLTVGEINTLYNNGLSGIPII